MIAERGFKILPNLSPSKLQKQQNWPIFRKIQLNFAKNACFGWGNG